MEVTPTVIPSQTELILASTSTTPPILRLRLQKKKPLKKVGWSDGTVDNEHMNKKKSKCCCIYKKPLAFGESSEEEDDECENCYGHPEKRIKTHREPNSDQPMQSDEESEPEEPRPHHCDSGICTFKKSKDGDTQN